MTVTVTIPTETARTCLPALRRALTDAEYAAEAAATASIFREWEARAVALDCLIHALERALAADAAKSDPPAGHSELAIARAMLGAP